MNNSKKGHLAGQIRRLRARFVQSAGSVLGDVLPAKSLKRWIREECGNYRQRIYGPLRTLTLFIEQVLSEDHSCQDAVARGLSDLVSQKQAPCSLNTAGYCKARSRLPLGLIARMGRETGDLLCAQQPEEWRWRGREVKLADGTTVSMPDTEANQASFPQSRSQKAGLGFPLARLVAIVSLSCGSVLDWAVGPCKGKQTGETAMLWKLAGQLGRGDIVIADRYYAGYFMIALFVQLGVDAVIRQHQLRHTDFRRGQRLGLKDHIVSWDRPTRPAWMDADTYATMPETLVMREMRIGGWTLVTTLTDAQEVSKQDLYDLYHLRWQIELDIRSIKEVMQMGVLRCMTPEMVEKEIAVHMLAYNMVRATMAQAAHLGHVLPRQLSFKGALQLLNAFGENLRHCPLGRLVLNHAFLLAGLAQMKLPHRPGRVEPRARKRRPKTHTLLNKPRKILRARLLKKLQKHIAACLS
jgi:hypothetical protein